MNFIFDLDGTLIDSKSCMVLALKYSFRKFGLKIPSHKQLEILVTNMSKELFLNDNIQRLSDKTLSDFLDSYRSYYLDIKLNKSVLFKDAIPVLEELKGRGDRVFLISNMHSIDLKNQCERLNLLPYFEGIYGAESFRLFKPHAEPILAIIEKHQLDKNETILIGDSHYDIRMGKAAGVHTYAVATGIDSYEFLTAEEPTLVCRSLSDLISN